MKIIGYAVIAAVSIGMLLALIHGDWGSVIFLALIILCPWPDNIEDTVRKTIQESLRQAQSDQASPRIILSSATDRQQSASRPAPHRGI